MKNISIIILLIVSLLIFGCNQNTENEVAIQQAQQNLERADSLQQEIEGHFNKIIFNYKDESKSRIKKFTNDICLNSTEAQDEIKQAIDNMEQAKSVTDDYQLKTFYDMRINAFQTKIDMAENSFMYANKIEDASNNDKETQELIDLYNKIHQKQEKNYDELMQRANDFIDLKST